jgi:hypothetical protein
VPRRNRPRDEDPVQLRSLLPVARDEVRRGRTYHVQPSGAASAEKAYRCPGCGREIEPGVAHLVIWRADGVLGDAADLAARRHWHTQCWRVA